MGMWQRAGGSVADSWWAGKRRARRWQKMRCAEVGGRGSCPPHCPAIDESGVDWRVQRLLLLHCPLLLLTAPECPELHQGRVCVWKYSVFPIL